MKVFIAEAKSAKASSGNPYLKIQFIDEQKVTKSATMFDASDPDSIQGKVCDVVLQLQENYPPKVLNCKVLEGEDPSVFYKTTSIDRQEATEFLKKVTRGNDILASLADEILFDNSPVWSRFYEWPAAKMIHHAYSGGLLEHTYGMAKIAEGMLASDPSCRNIDRDVLMCAVVLHDVGKVLEYEWKIPGPAGMSDRGILLGHISLLDELVVRACVKKKTYSTRHPVLHLRHCLLAHHGKKEWGSPVRPATAEAVLLHQLDMIQSNAQIIVEAVAELEPGKHEYHKVLGSDVMRLQ